MDDNNGSLNKKVQPPPVSKNPKYLSFTDMYIKLFFNV